MIHRTALPSSFEAYLASEDYAPEIRIEEERERACRLSRFPYGVTLQVSFPELDFANRWCWQHFGPSDGDCLQRQSDYPACDVAEPHSHTGSWMWYWLAKTDYNFGFCEWYFSEQLDRDSFLASVGEINWGEKYA
jgi:hypothetical protein